LIILLLQVVAVARQAVVAAAQVDTDLTMA
jgi:hypothetical protein